MAKASDNKFPKVYLTTVASNPSTPTGGDWKVFAKADGIYAMGSNASATGPFGVGGGGLADQGTFTYLDATEAAAPSTPASGKVRVYAKSDGRIYSKDDGGVEYGPFDAAGGGSGSSIYRTRPFMMSPLSSEAIGLPLSMVDTDGPTSMNSPLADSALFVPFIVETTMTAYKMWWFNGAAVAGNVDVGIYDVAGNRLVSIGPTAQATTSVIQEVNIADTVLTPDTYFMAWASDTSGATQRFGSMTAAVAGVFRALGVLQMDSLSSGTLPSTATFTATTVTWVPMIGVAGRTLVV